MGLDTRGWKRGVWRGGWWGRQGLDQLGTGGSNWGPSLIFQRSWEMQMKPLLDAKLTWIRVSTQGTHRDRNKHILVTPPHPTLWPSFCPLSPNYLSPQWVNLIKDIICIWRFLFLQRFMIESFQKRKPALIENVLCARCCSINWKKKTKSKQKKTLYWSINLYCSSEHQRTGWWISQTELIVINTQIKKQDMCNIRGTFLYLLPTTIPTPTKSSY